MAYRSKGMAVWLLLLVLVSSMMLVSGCQLMSLHPVHTVEEEKITLTFRHFWVGKHDQPVEQIVSEAISRFENEHPHIKINFEGMDQTIHREQKLKSEMVTGQPPDIFFLFGGAEIEPYAEAGRLLNLTPYLEEQGLMKDFIDLSLWTFDGKVYGVPLEGNAEPLYYNKTLFGELGLEPPQTVEDLFELISRFHEAGIIPFALGNDQQWPAAIYVHYLMDRQIGSELIYQIVAGDASFDNPDYLTAMEMFDRMVKEGAFPQQANQLSTEQAVSLFASGRAAMYLNGNWDISLLKGESAPAGFEDEVGVISFPVMNSVDSAALAGGYTVGFGLSSVLEGSRQEAALALLQALYQPDIRQRIVEEAYRIPAMTGRTDKSRIGPIYSQVIQMTEESSSMFVPYDNVLPPEVKQTFLHVIARIMNQSITPEESLRELDQAMQQYLALVQSR